MPEQRVELKRHIVPLTLEETDEVVSVVADMIVRFLQVDENESNPPGSGNGSPEPTVQTVAGSGR